MDRYASMTVDDPNVVKRFLQRRRHAVAEALFRDLPADFGGRILDYGAGDGRLAARLAATFPAARIVAFEPADWIRAEGRAFEDRHENLRFTSNLDAQPDGRFDYVVCNEVLEHLPERETDDLLDGVGRLVRHDGHVLIGVPNELHLAALVRGAFRMLRRYGAYDARIGNVLRCAWGRPPVDRPVDEIGPGLAYHYPHVGFDHRRLAATLAERFDVERVFGSPFPGLPGWLNWANFEIYFHCRPREVARPALRLAA